MSMPPNVGLMEKASIDDLKEIICYQQGQIQELLSVVNKLASDNIRVARDQNILSENQRLIQSDMARLRDAVISLSTPNEEKH